VYVTVHLNWAVISI